MSVRSIMATHCVTVARNSRICDQKRLALYFSITMSSAPAVSTGMSAASWKLEWQAGMVVSRRSLRVSDTSQSAYRPLNRMFACVSTTPLGREVVPEVKMISAGSSEDSSQRSVSSTGAPARRAVKSRSSGSAASAARASGTPSTSSSSMRAAKSPLGSRSPSPRSSA